MLIRGFSGLPMSCLCMKSPTQTNGEYEDHKEMLLIQGILQGSILCLYTEVQNVPPSCSHPFCRHADKMQDKGFQPACLFQRLDLFADMYITPNISVCCLPSLSFKGLRYTTSLYDFPSMRLSMLTEVTSYLS